MKKHLAWLVVIFLWPRVWAGVLPKELSDLFQYDAKTAFNVQELSNFERDGVKVRDILFDSPKGGRVPAYVVEPIGPGPHAGVVFGHWGNGIKTEFLDEAMLYAKAGAVSVLIDYPWVRPAPWRRLVNDFAKPAQDRDVYIQAVVDLRRALDLLESRADIDRNRLGYVGHSYGAQWGAILSAVDGRIKTAVLVSGIPSLGDVFLGDDPDMIELRKALPQGQLENYLKTVGVLDAIHYVLYAAPRALLFQFARHERGWDEAVMKRYAAAGSDPKDVKWYDTGHETNDIRAVADRAFWLEKHIGLQPVLPLLRAKLGV